MEEDQRCLTLPACHVSCCEIRIPANLPHPELHRLDADWDAIVIGAGPAGTSAAIPLAQQGRRVLLVERKSLPRFKVCGCCLNQQAVNHLRQLDLREPAMEAGAVSLQRFQWASAGLMATLSLPGGLALSRERLDALLVERAVNAGVCVITQVTASLGGDERSRKRVALNRNDESVEVTAKIVVVAAGLAGRTMMHDDDPPLMASHSYVGVGCMVPASEVAHCSRLYEPGVIYMASGADGYVGLTRVENHQLNIAAALAPTALHQATPDEVCRNLLETAGIGELSLQSSADWTGTLPLTGWRQRTSASRTLFVGDAAGYVEPFTGEGMAWALTAGRMAADFIDAAQWSPERELKWDALYGAVRRKQQKTCRRMSRFLRHPQLVQQSIRLLKLCPGLARPFLRRVAGRSQ